MDLNKEWMKIKNRSCREYVDGVNGFLNFALRNIRNEDKDTITIRCPCDSCRNIIFKQRCEVRFDLLKRGMYENYTVWEFHGETIEYFDGEENNLEGEENNVDSEVNMLEDACGVAGFNLGDDTHIYNGNDMSEEPIGEAAKFYRLLKEYQEPLTTNGVTMSKLSYIVKLLHLKVLNNWSDSSFDSLLKLHAQAWGTSLPDSYYEAKKLIADLGLECVKIDACNNDCILYWREAKHLNECPTCGLCRWKTDDKGSYKGKKVPHKVLQYFPLKSRLQRLYMSRKTAKDMRWHKEKRVEDGIMRHPADSFAWKSFDDEYSSFSDDARNVRLGLACDGFQPFKDSQYSICPVVLIPYNLPPWICMKAYSFILTLLIPGPSSPGRDIDVYLQPLIEELKELWEIGIETYDAHSKTNFVMRTAVLWTINDFPAYADLSGWSTKGHFACPCCHKETRRTSLMNKGGYMGHRRWLPHNHRWRKDANSFDKTKEKGSAPTPLTGDDVLAHYSRFQHETFGKLCGGRKRKFDSFNSLYGWQKKSIFFELPYWTKLKIRHNLDVMHIEKNVSDNILGTIMNIKDRTKDTIKARIDLVNMGIRDELHPILDGDKVHVPIVCYTLNANAKAAVCEMFARLKSPDGYLSNISRCVKDNGRKISCMKSHDHHVFIEQLLPIAIHSFLPRHVCEPLIELSIFFRNLCSKSICLEELDILERHIPYTLCKLEMVFPPAFFDVMVHLVVHLAAEAKIAGPVRYRWMYPIERYLRTLKKYIRNRARPEGCIVEGYLANECLTFCSRYMDDIATKFNRKDRNDDDNEGYIRSKLEIFSPLGRPIGQGVPHHLTFEECEQVHLYVLQNCDELVQFIKEHKMELERENPRQVEQRHKSQFSKWIHHHVRKLHKEGQIDDDVYNLVCYPSRLARRYSGHIVNGFRFHTDDRCDNRKTQNSGVMVKGDDQSSDKEYYGVLKDVFQLQYPGRNHVYVFKCHWFDVNHGRGYKIDEYGMISVNKTRSLKTDELFVLESQVEQVFYIQDPKYPDWKYVIKTQPRDLYDMPNEESHGESMDIDAYQQEEVNVQSHIVGEGEVDNFVVNSLATDAFVVQGEASAVKLVTISKEKRQRNLDDDDEIEVFKGSSEEDGLHSDDSE